MTAYNYHPCEICGKIYKSNGGLKRHLDKVHRVDEATHWLCILVKKIMWRLK